jgi:hypothetical protein
LAGAGATAGALLAETVAAEGLASDEGAEPAPAWDASPGPVDNEVCNEPVVGRRTPNRSRANKTRAAANNKPTTKDQNRLPLEALGLAFERSGETSASTGIDGSGGMALFILSV